MYKKEIDNFAKRYTDKDLEIEKIDYPELINGNTCYFHIHFKIPKTNFIIYTQGDIRHKGIRLCDHLYGFRIVGSGIDPTESQFLVSVANCDFEKLISNFDKYREEIIIRMDKIKELKKQLLELTSFSFKKINQKIGNQS